MGFGLRVQHLNIFLLFALTSPAAHAASQLYFLNEDAISLESFRAPPKAASKRDEKDLKAVRHYQAVRTTEDCKRASVSADHLDLRSFFGAPYGPLSDAEINKASPIYWSIMADTDYFTNHLKAKWGRPRPYLRDAQIQPCVSLHYAASYPSGHSAIAWTEARVLGVIFPKKRAALLARANRIAEDRVLGGVHHPSDIQAGKNLSNLIFEALMNSEEFSAQIKTIKKRKEISHENE